MKEGRKSHQEGASIYKNISYGYDFVVCGADVNCNQSRVDPRGCEVICPEKLLLRAVSVCHVLYLASVFENRKD
jgi:hypothetical protein